MFIYGLTGGIACGKSTLAGFFQQRGWQIVDSDEIAHRLLEPGAVNWQKVVDLFGSGLLNADRTVNRAALGDLVFTNSQLREKLNVETHPAIRQAWRDECSRCLSEQPNRPLLVAIPLLFEKKIETDFSKILCVGCSRATQLQRLAGRGLTPAQAEARLASQLPVSEKIRWSDFVFWNEGSREQLARQIDFLPKTQPNSL